MGRKISCPLNLIKKVVTNTEGDIKMKREAIITKGGTHQVCLTCNQEKLMTEENFHKANNSSGFKTQCKECRKQYYLNNKEEKLKYQHEYLKENKAYYKTYQEQYKHNGKDSVTINMKDFKKGILPDPIHIDNKLDFKFNTDGLTSINGREFSRLIGGFGDDKPFITVRQISKLLDSADKVINQTINRNIKSFSEGIDLIDIKKNKSVTLSDRDLVDLNYSRQSISNSKNIYILSQAGFLLYLKFAEGDKAIELYKNFIEDYFKTKVELEVAENTIKKNNETLQDAKKMLIGSLVMECDESKKIDIFMQLEKINTQLIENAKTLAKEETIEQFKDIVTIADKFTNGKACYDIALFSKILNIQDLGRNNMFKWMRGEKMLQGNNTPYQNMVDYFKVIKIDKEGRVFTKTLLKAKGVKFVVNRLIKNGYIDNMSKDEVLEVLKDLQEVA